MARLARYMALYKSYILLLLLVASYCKTINCLFYYAVLVASIVVQSRVMYITYESTYIIECVQPRDGKQRYVRGFGKIELL